MWFVIVSSEVQWLGAKQPEPEEGLENQGRVLQCCRAELGSAAAVHEATWRRL